MKKYLLTIFGDFKTDAICKEIALSLSPVVDSPNLKFQYTKGVLLFHFGSDMDLKDIHEFLEILSYDLFESFILSEFTDKVSVLMPQETIQHLFNLDKEGESGQEMVLIPRNNVEYVDDTQDDEFVALLLDEVKKKLKQPSLDQLLDKIKNEGIDSLTPFEKGTLENYSKN